MTDELKPQDPKTPELKASKPKTKLELLSADPDSLTTDELNRRAIFIDLD